MKICVIPIDNRPVCYDFVRDICNIDSCIELYLPPKEFMGDLNKVADFDKLINWLKALPSVEKIIVSLDTLVYGGLIPSRRGNFSLEDLEERLRVVKKVLQEKQGKIYAFSSIMRISNNNINVEEKPYWDKYGKKIFDYSYYTHKNGGFFSEESCVEKLIPDDILNDYLSTRRRNFEINKKYLSWQKEGFFETLIFSKDDCAEYGLNVMEAIELEKLGGEIKTGADEIPLVLLARAIEKDVKLFVEFSEPEYKNLISNYEDISIEKSVLSEIELSGMKVVDKKEDADLVLFVNNFKEKQGEYVMKIETEAFSSDKLFFDKPFAIADVRFANGADNKLVDILLKDLDMSKFYGYAAWNTSANTVGSLLAMIKTKFKANKYNEDKFKKLQTIRFLDDWAYQANVRQNLDTPINIDTMMNSYELKVFNALNVTYKPTYTYPWDRLFEICVNL